MKTYKLLSKQPDSNNWEDIFKNRFDKEAARILAFSLLEQGMQVKVESKGVGE
jgi:hypothetical protein